MHKIAFWAGFGVAVRFWQLGIEMRPFFYRGSLWVYPVYASVGGAFGYWLTGVEADQVSFLVQKRNALLEKRKRKAEAEGRAVDEEALPVPEKPSLTQALKEAVGDAFGAKNEDEGIDRVKTVREATTPV